MGSAATYIEHDAGEDIEAAISSTRAEAVARLGGEAKVTNATSQGVTWRREWEDAPSNPELETEPGGP